MSHVVDRFDGLKTYGTLADGIYRPRAAVDARWPRHQGRQAAIVGLPRVAGDQEDLATTGTLEINDRELTRRTASQMRVHLDAVRTVRWYVTHTVSTYLSQLPFSRERVRVGCTGGVARG